ncbi:MAG: hypothetical protein QXU69_07480 [Thermofilaceae archaeon]
MPVLVVRCRPGAEVCVRTYPGFQPVFEGVAWGGAAAVEVPVGRYAVMAHAPGATSGLAVVDVGAGGAEVALELVPKPVRCTVTVEVASPGPAEDVARRLAEELEKAGMEVEEVSVSGGVVRVRYVDRAAPLWVVLALILAILVALIVLSFRVDVVSLAREMWAVPATVALIALMPLAYAAAEALGGRQRSSSPQSSPSRGKRRQRSRLPLRPLRLRVRLMRRLGG